MAGSDGRLIDRVVRGARAFKPPVHEPRFWVVQAGVLTVAVVHDVLLVALHAHDLAGVPAPITSSLLLIPVVYAALNFGVRGAMATAVWATVLLVPHWFVVSRVSATHLWIEAGYLLILNAAAFVVGQRVENERRARERAEAALRAADLVTARYQALFEEQPSPVIITDAYGVITEVNSTATRLLGGSAIGQRIDELLGANLGGVLEGQPSTLTLRNADGDIGLFAPTARRLTLDGADLVQVILTDVTQQRRRQEEQRRFARQLLTVQEDERRRLAQDLHDDPLQQLTYLSRTLDDLSQHHGLAAESSEQLARSAAVATEAAGALRKVIHGLRPPVLDDLGLVSALRQLVGQTRQRTGLTIDFRVVGKEERLPPGLELAAYRIVQESLNNIVRHAGASHATLQLRYDSELTITVTDNGRGLEPERRSGLAASGLGLVGMRERVSMAGGTLEVGPRPRRRGTVVRAVLPLHQEPRWAPAAERPPLTTTC